MDEPIHRLTYYYNREFFPEEAFTQVRYGEMTLKGIRGGVRSNADLLLDWIHKGCYDALKHKYLETVTLGIFTDLQHPDQILESYTLKFAYPNSRDHELLSQIRAQATCVGVEVKMIDGGTKEINANSQGSFKQQIIRMLRILCIMVQTLSPLPDKKYVSMQLTYYDELTPNGYEPPGFAATIFELAYAFKKPTFKQDFGSAQSNCHRVQLTMETTMAGDERAVEAPQPVPVAKETITETKPPEIQETLGTT